MEYKNIEYSKEEKKKEKKKINSQLVIEANTIYEIDLDCQYQKECQCQKNRR